MLTEKQMRALRDEAARLDNTAEEAKTEARKLAENAESEGVDLSKDREAFDKIDAKFREGSEAAEEAQELRARYQRALEARSGDDRKASQRRLDDIAEQRDKLSLGQRVTRSDNYERFREMAARDLESAIRAFGAIEVATRDEARDVLQTRAVSQTGEALLTDDRVPGIDEFPRRPVKFLDLITVGETDSDTVDYVVENAPTEAILDNAGYGTDPDVDADAYTESDFAFEEKTVGVKRMGTYVPATEAQLADIGQFRTLVDNRLRNALRRKVEKQVIAGNTAGGDTYNGIINTAGINTYARDTVNSENRHDAVHKGITKIRLAAFDDPQVVGMHPNDYEKLVLEKDSAGNYLNGRGVNEPKTIWGLAAIPSAVVPEGTALLGNFSNAYLWMREGIAVTASDSHSDWFLKDWVAIKASLRAAFAVIRPVEFCTVTSF